MRHYLAGTAAPEHLNFARFDPVESMFFRHPVNGDEEPRQCISQGAVKIEHRELVSHDETPPFISSQRNNAVVRSALYSPIWYTKLTHGSIQPSHRCSPACPSVSGQERSRSFHGALKLMNNLLYYEPLADLFEADATYQDASTQVRFGYLTLAASFHWNLLKLFGNVAPIYHLAPPVTSHDPTLAQLPYLSESLKLH